VISDLDFNVTTDTKGHVTDANAAYSTRSITAANVGALPITGGTMTGELQVNARLDVGDGSGGDHEIRIYKGDNNVSDHIQFYNGTTRMGEIGCEDTTWLRINQETAKNIYTPRYIRSDGGFYVDSTSKGINGSGNYIGGTITGASDANVSNWDTAYTHSQATHAPTNAEANRSISDSVSSTSSSVSASSKAVKTAYDKGNHSHPYDNYNGWDLQVNGGTVNRVTTGENVNFVGSGATSVSQSGTTVTISSTDTNTNTDTIDMGDGFKIANSAGTDQFTVTENEEIRFAGSGATSVSFDASTQKVTISSTDTDTVYSHPTHPGDDINLDTGALTGATVISDLDFNVTTDTKGHVTDANAAYSTRSITAADVGALPITGGTLDNGTNTTLTVKCDDDGRALIRAHGDSQGTGAIEVGQSDAYGGGMSYNGDGSPAFVSGETDDNITFYRLEGGTRYEVFHYPYNSNVVNFNETPKVGGTTVALSNHTHSYDNYNGWDLQVNGGTVNRVTTGENVNFVGSG
ncbi:MAG: hypothetical protein GY918_02340, partial [Gammaproteobacteria bacterium]|nr:hypothetical protein [Gammaproteobacteria bacterium]